VYTCVCVLDMRTCWMSVYMCVRFGYECVCVLDMSVCVCLLDVRAYMCMRFGYKNVLD